MTKTRKKLIEHEIKKEFSEGPKALGCLFAGIVLMAGVFFIIFNLIKNLR